MGCSFTDISTLAEVHVGPSDMPSGTVPGSQARKLLNVILNVFDTLGIHPEHF